MRISVLALLLALAAAPAVAADPVPIAEAAQHVGQTVTVVGVLSEVHTNAKKYIFLNFGGTYPNAAFSAVIFGKTMHNPPDFAALVGKTLSITGKIKMYHGKPEIVIDSASQIAIARPPAP